MTTVTRFRNSFISELLQEFKTWFGIMAWLSQEQSSSALLCSWQVGKIPRTRAVFARLRLWWCAIAKLNYACFPIGCAVNLPVGVNNPFIDAIFSGRIRTAFGRERSWRHKGTHQKPESPSRTRIRAKLQTFD